MPHPFHPPELPQGHRILPMRRADLARVHALEVAGQKDPWGLESFSSELENRHSTVDLYWCSDELAGYLCSWLVVGELQIQNLVTSPAWRRRGIASRLLENVLARRRAAGMGSAWLEVLLVNAAAIDLYRRYGFRVTGCRRAYYLDGEDALLMALDTHFTTGESE